MPLPTDTLTALQEALGEEHGDLYSQIATSNGEDISQLDSLRAAAQASGTEMATLQGRFDEAVAARDQYKADFEALKSDDAVEKLTASRDAERQSATEWKQKYETMVADQRSKSIARQLEAALFEGAPALPTDEAERKVELQKRSAAMRLLGVPEGVDLDESGNLVGHVEAVKRHREQNPFLFTKAGVTGNTGGAPGADDPPKSKAKTDADKTAADRQRGRDAATKYFDRMSPRQRLMQKHQPAAKQQ